MVMATSTFGVNLTPEEFSRLLEQSYASSSISFPVGGGGRGGSSSYLMPYIMPAGPVGGYPLTVVAESGPLPTEPPPLNARFAVLDLD